jgi:polycomb protein EED
MAITDDNAFELPKLRSSFILENDTEFLENDNVAEFFDVKFCPYQPLDAPPVFAAISKKHVSPPWIQLTLSRQHLTLT